MGVGVVAGKGTVSTQIFPPGSKPKTNTLLHYSHWAGTTQSMAGKTCISAPDESSQTSAHLRTLPHSCVFFRSAVKTEMLTSSKLFTRLLGCVHTAGKSDSNLIPSQIWFLGLTVHTVFSKCPNLIWLCSDWATLMTNLTGCCGNVI